MNTPGAQRAYPHDLPGALQRLCPTMKNKMMIANPEIRKRDIEVNADFDESGLIAISRAVAPEIGYSVTHVPTGVRYHYLPMTMADALDFANWLTARLDAIRALELDYTKVDGRNTATIIADPGNVNEEERRWRAHWRKRANF